MQLLSSSSRRSPRACEVTARSCGLWQVREHLDAEAVYDRDRRALEEVLALR